MKAPDKIYLAWEYSEIDTLPPGVTAKQVFGNDVCYIRKDALLEWAKEKNKRIDTDEGDYSLGYVSAMIDLIDKLDSM